MESTVSVTNNELEISHSVRAWTKGSISSSLRYDLTRKAIVVRVICAANADLDATGARPRSA